jgi:ribonucleoside-diphosphate reductase alpha chain
MAIEVDMKWKVFAGNSYRGLGREEIDGLLTSPEKILARASEEERSYLEKALDVNSFYVGRMSPQGNDLASGVTSKKYLGPGESGPLHIWHRQAMATAEMESTPEKQEKAYFQFMRVLDDYSFVPGGRIMYGCGREDVNVTVNNCYVTEVESDSIRAMYKNLEEEGLTFKAGGGCGHNISIYRPLDSDIDGTGGQSCGPVGFMEISSVNTDTIAQHGRRGALMLNIGVWHPDSLEFIKKKSDRTSVKHANVSLLVGKEFMDSLEVDGDFNLVFPDIGAYSEIPEAKEFYNEVWDGDIERWQENFKKAQEKGKIPSDLKSLKIHDSISSRKLWDEAISHAHEFAEPGILYWDTMKEFHNLEYCSPLSSTNPCGEQPLPKDGCCNLGHVNLERLVNSDGEFNFDLFESRIRTGVRFLDNIIDYNSDRHALPGQKKNALSDRRIGLGITSLADMFIRMGIKYDSERALEFTDKMMKFKMITEYDESVNLAVEKGNFPNYDWEGLKKSKFIQNLPEELQRRIETEGLRNGTISTVAPVGSGAIVAEGSGGIEPMFAISYERDVKTNKGDEIETFTVVYPLLEDLFGGIDNLPDYVVESHEIDPEFRVRMQGVVQKYIDTSISSTINLPRDVPFEVVDKIYRMARTERLKGVTVYREGSREGVMRTNSSIEEIGDKDISDSEFQTALLKRIERPRPNFVIGATEKIATPHGLNLFAKTGMEYSAEGDLIGPYESILNLGKSGGDLTAMVEGFGRITSLAFKAGIPCEKIFEQLEGIGGSGHVGLGSEQVRSVPEAIAKGMLQSMEKTKQLHRILIGEETGEDPEEKKGPIFSGNLCNSCGGNMRMEGGCSTCCSCGLSKC